MSGRYDGYDEVKPHLQQAAALRLRIKTDESSYAFPSVKWSAVVEGTEDAEFDFEAGHYVATCMVGQGATEEDAVADLLEQLGVTV